MEGGWKSRMRDTKWERKGEEGEGGGRARVSGRERG